jgi:superfamily II DNA or RNA helicase
VSFERFAPNSTLYDDLEGALRQAVRDGRVRAGGGKVTAVCPPPNRIPTEVWRVCLLRSMVAGSTHRENAIVRAIVWARANLGRPFTPAPNDGPIVVGLRSALNSAIRRGEIERLASGMIRLASARGSRPKSRAPRPKGRPRPKAQAAHPRLSRATTRKKSPSPKTTQREPQRRTPMAPEPGQIVRVRSRKYLVEAVSPSKNGSVQTLVSLSCLDDDAQGQPLSVLWEQELDAIVCDAAAWDAVAKKGFDDPRLFSAYLHAHRWNCVTSTDPRLFQAPYRAGIDVQAYQLEPLRMALHLPRVNLFIADDVGLGKTIEAGLILRELIMRQKVRRVVVAAPPSVVLQWRDELDHRFGLSFAVVDRDFIAARRRERGYSVNPWETHSRFIISHALLRDEDYAGPLRNWLQKGNNSIGSLLILDEAHNAAPASGAKYAVDSQLTRVVRDVAKWFEHRLFLSATPHNGHSNSFSALLEILDPQRFCRGVPVKGAKALQPIMVRRLKADLQGVVTGLPDREVIQVSINDLPKDAPELELSRLLAEYGELRGERMKESPASARSASGLVITSLQKRLLSSIEAFAHTLRVHRRYLDKKEPPSTEGDTSSPVDEFDADDERSERPEAEIKAEVDGQVGRATARAVSAVRLSDRERKILDEMERIAEEARGLPDRRVEYLVDWIRDHLCPGLPTAGKTRRPSKLPAWNDSRVLIFTEYTDTKRYLEQQLRSAIEGTDDAEHRIETFAGGNDEKREEIKRAFNGDPTQHPLRILIATDAAREGVNLQNHCADLFHFDVPWNPSRMEQRNGRIDRKLQRAKVVHCRYFVFSQRPEDRVLKALVDKTQTIRKELGSLSPVIEGKLVRLLQRGFVHRDADEYAAEIEKMEATAEGETTIRGELETVRTPKPEVAEQIKRLRDILERSQKFLGLDEGHFRDALSQSLELLGAEPLRRLSDEDASDGREPYTFPPVGRLEEPQESRPAGS